MEVKVNVGNSVGKKQKDGKDLVRRPMNAFLIFCKRHRAMVKANHPNIDNRNVTRILGDLWANANQSEKAKYADLAKEYKEAFMRANPDFRWHHERSSTSQHCKSGGTRPVNSNRPDGNPVTPDKGSPTEKGFEEFVFGSSDSDDSPIKNDCSLLTTAPSRTVAPIIASSHTRTLPEKAASSGARFLSAKPFVKGLETTGSAPPKTPPSSNMRVEDSSGCISGGGTSNSALLELAMMCTNELLYDETDLKPKEIPSSELTKIKARPHPSAALGTPLVSTLSIPQPIKTDLKISLKCQESEKISTKFANDTHRTDNYPKQLGTIFDSIDSIIREEINADSLKCKENDFSPVLGLVNATQNRIWKISNSSDKIAQTKSVAEGISNDLKTEIKLHRSEEITSSPNVSVSQSEAGNVDFPPITVDDDRVRKSKRSNRGKRYKELIQQGYIQPPKVEKLLKKYGETNCSEYLSQSLNESSCSSHIVAKKRHISEPTGPGGRKFKTGDFDLEAHIAELPMCSIDTVSKPKLAKLRKRHESVTGVDLSPLEISYDEKVNQLDKSLTGSQKRKARRRTITHLVPQSPTSHVKVPAQWLNTDISQHPNGSTPKSLSTDVTTTLSDVTPISNDVTTTSSDVTKSSLGSTETTRSIIPTNQHSPSKSRDSLSTNSLVFSTSLQSLNNRDSPDPDRLVIDENCENSSPNKELKIRKLDYKDGQLVTVGYLSSLPTRVKSNITTPLNREKFDRENGAASARLFRPALNLDPIRPRSTGHINTTLQSDNQRHKNSQLNSLNLERVKVDLRWIAKSSPKIERQTSLRDHEDLLSASLRCTEEISSIMRGISVINPLKNHD